MLEVAAGRSHYSGDSPFLPRAVQVDSVRHPPPTVTVTPSMIPDGWLGTSEGAGTHIASPRPRHQLDSESKAEAATDTRTQIAALPLGVADPTCNAHQAQQAGNMLNAGGGNVIQSESISGRPSSPGAIRTIQRLGVKGEPPSVTVAVGKPRRRGKGDTTPRRKKSTATDQLHETLPLAGGEMKPRRRLDRDYSQPGKFRGVRYRGKGR